MDDKNQREEAKLRESAKAIKKQLPAKQEAESLGERIRTSGLLNPIQARYQTAPHPDNPLSSAGSEPNRTTSDNISRSTADVNSFYLSNRMKKPLFQVEKAAYIHYAYRKGNQKQNYGFAFSISAISF